MGVRAHIGGHCDCGNTDEEGRRQTSPGRRHACGQTGVRSRAAKVRPRESNRAQGPENRHPWSMRPPARCPVRADTCSIRSRSAPVQCIHRPHVHAPSQLTI